MIFVQNTNQDSIKMKRLLSLVLLMAALTAGTTATAQESAAANAQSETRQRLTREQLADTQARRIAGELAFDKATTEKFVATYAKCQKEVWALGPQHKPQGGRMGKPNGKPAAAQGNTAAKPAAPQSTEEEAGKQLQERFDRSQKMLDIRQKYYKEYSKFLTQKQIERVYQIERQMLQQLAKKRRPQGQRPQGQRPAKK